MEKLVGIRKEDKNIWEKRVPIVPQHMKELISEHNINFIDQEFPNRIFTKDLFIEAGAKVSENIDECPFIFAVKEVPINLIEKEKVYMFFSHTIKGQDYNMPLLKKIMENKSTLIDYEPITDEKGRRLVFFGRFAGIAGMIETLNGLGQRLKYKGFDTPFSKIKHAFEYSDSDDAKEHIKLIAEEINKDGLPSQILPLSCGFAGYGNLSRGAEEIFDVLPHQEITPEDLLSNEKNNSLLKVVFKEEDLVENVNDSESFELLDYYNNPKNYKSRFKKYLTSLDVLINAIYWTEDYPKLVTKEYLKNDNNKLDIICDISCDIDGSVEITNKVTEPDNPAFTINPKDDSFKDGYNNPGVVNIAVDNLPAELPKDASMNFSQALFPFIPGIVNANYESDFDDADLPPEIKRAVIVYKGKLTPNFKYLEKFI